MTANLQFIIEAQSEARDTAKLKWEDKYQKWTKKTHDQTPHHIDWHSDNNVAVVPLPLMP